MLLYKLLLVLLQIPSYDAVIHVWRAGVFTYHLSIALCSLIMGWCVCIILHFLELLSVVQWNYHPQNLSQLGRSSWERIGRKKSSISADMETRPWRITVIFLSFTVFTLESEKNSCLSSLHTASEDKWIEEMLSDWIHRGLWEMKKGWIGWRGFDRPEKEKEEEALCDQGTNRDASLWLERLSRRGFLDSRAHQK